MKKILIIIVVGGMVALLDAQLRIRQQNPTWRASECIGCANMRGAIVPYGVANADDAVNALREKVIQSEDNGTYQADWGKYRRRELEIESQLGYTVEEEDSFDQAYDD